jgi:hypothetical protein
LLLLAVSVGRGGVLLSVLPPVVGIAGSPFSGTVPAHFPIFGIGGDPGAVIIGATPTLAIAFAANSLAALEPGRLEDLLAVGATPFTHMNGVFAYGRRGPLPARI